LFWRDHWIHGDVIAEFVDPTDPDDDPQLVNDCHWADIATEEVEIKGARCFADAVQCAARSVLVVFNYCLPSRIESRGSGTLNCSSLFAMTGHPPMM
jgi:hypothetical protein